MENQLSELIETIKEDYLNWTRRSAKSWPFGSNELSSHNLSMIEEFNDRLSWTVGSKYIKVISNGGVWGFIVNTENDKKFRMGDILMAAGWNTPARNAARGNLFENYDVSWTGPHYLR